MKQAPLRILAVEDEPIAAIVLSRVLDQLGHQVDSAASAEEALEKAQTTDYGCIIMDIGLPDMSGLAAAQAIRGSASPNRDTPIIACTAYTDPTLEDACIRAGIQAIIYKLIVATTFKETLMRYTSKT